VHSTRSSKW